ncbi:hypothetical protein [Tumidithrix helvetica]|uniref:hypothetical protein n=1 Tax=Tumidithrix helvetica TaxID=3457545 RepID=UPI003CC6773E
MLYPLSHIPIEFRQNPSNFFFVALTFLDNVGRFASLPRDKLLKHDIPKAAKGWQIRYSHVIPNAIYPTIVMIGIEFDEIIDWLRWCFGNSLSQTKYASIGMDVELVVSPLAKLSAPIGAGFTARYSINDFYISLDIVP